MIDIDEIDEASPMDGEPSDDVLLSSTPRR
jgi:hypothetical protein